LRETKEHNKHIFCIIICFVLCGFANQHGYRTCQQDLNASDLHGRVIQLEKDKHRQSKKIRELVIENNKLKIYRKIHKIKGNNE